MHETVQDPLLLITYVIGPIVLLIALVYGFVAWRRRRRGPMVEAGREAATDRAFEKTTEGGAAAPPLRPAREPPPELTEDQVARAALGGTRGAPQLGEAPMVPQQAKNTPREFDPGHTA